MNKKITAIIAAAILALNISVPVFAEQESEITSDTSVLSAEESPESETDISDNEDTEDNADSKTDSSAGEDEPEVSENSDEKPKKVYYTDYAIPEAEMYISFPNDMYVLTRNIDIDSPILKASGMTKTELIKEFEQTGIYIKATSADFTYEVTVNILKNDSTKTIDDISKLTDEEIQTITNNQLSQPMYNKGCSRTVYNNVMYLSFPFEYSEDKTKIAGIQKYTIFKGARIVITFQSYTGEISKDFDDLILSVMERVLYDGVSPEPETSNVSSKNSGEITNLDVRYIYLLLTGLVALIFLTLIITTAMRYKKSQKDSLPEPENPEEKSEKEETEESPEEEIPEKIEESPKEEEIPEKTEESPKEEEIPEKTEESPKEEEIPEKTEESPKEEEIPEKTEKEEIKLAKNTPVAGNQLELVEIALRIIPELTPENEDKTEIWNFIYKKYDDMEFFAAHGNPNYSNANDFYKINANSNIIPPPPKKDNVDETIRNETLENVVGDSKPEELKTEKPPVKETTDLNELIGGDGDGTDGKAKTDTQNEIYHSDKTKDTSK